VLVKNGAATDANGRPLGRQGVDTMDQITIVTGDV